MRFLFLAALLFSAPSVRAVEARALWTGGVQALLDQHCVKCHGPLEQKLGLELDTLEGVLKGSEDGAVIVPGRPEDSLLIAALERGADPHMPPKKQLAPEEIAKLRAWVAALGKPVPASVAEASPPPLPAMEPTAAIHHFLAAGWQTRGVTPAPVCDDQTFARRVFLDLAGRLPTHEEVAAFLAESAEGKREALVDRLLASDEYARTFREIWDALLMGRNVGRREQRRRDNGWFAFLESAFKNNRGMKWCARDDRRPLKQAHYWGLVAAFNRSKNVEKTRRR